MKRILTAMMSLVAVLSVSAQNLNLPSPDANNQTLPAGSYVIAMDNTNQLNSAGYFNLKSYGLIVNLLNNNSKLKWVIKAGKSKNGNDFTVNASPLLPVITTVTRKITTTNGSTAATVDNASGLVVGMTITSGSAGLQAGTTIATITGTSITLSLPATANIGNKDATFTSYTYPVTSYNFKAGPFVIFAQDTTGVGALINTYNNAFGVYADKIKVYKTAASVTVDVRYDLSGFRPKANILNDGNNTAIHVGYMTNCGITTANYSVGAATDLYTRCYTFASEPHNGTENTAAINAIKSFLQHGGNFLAECLAVETYENSTSGRFQTTNGISVSNTNVSAVNTVYPNPDLAFTQFEGVYDVDISGSCKNWTLASGSAWKNNAHNHATGGTIVTQTPIGASVAKLTGSALPGGLVFYIGNHEFSNLADVSEVNGIRMYMNAFLTPVAINVNCAVGAELPNPLPVKLLSFTATPDKNQTRVELQWNTATESNLSHFIVERSTDGKTFTDAGLVYAFGNTTEEKQYRFSDPLNLVAAKIIYYRLRQVDLDGDSEYSMIRSVRLNSSSSPELTLQLYPNPADRQVTVRLPAAWEQQPVQLELLNLAGQRVFHTASKAVPVIQLDISRLEPGIYILLARSGEQVARQKLVRQ